MERDARSVLRFLMVAWIVSPAEAQVNVTEIDNLEASNGLSDAFFGRSVCISDDSVIVGAPQDSLGTGSAYVFRDGPSGWTQEAELLAINGDVGDRFGQSVAIDGDTVVAGAFFDDAPLQNSGSAYVFVRNGTAWSQQAQLTPTVSAAGNLFGWFVDIEGDTALIGSLSAGGTGAAYVFVRSGTTWSQQAMLVGASSNSGDEFGFAVGLSGDTAVIGARRASLAGPGSGGAYVFTRAGTTWSEQAELVGSDTASGDWFGEGVAISGDRIVVGARHDDDAGTSSGSGYIFERSGSVWTEQAKLVAADAGGNHWFGEYVAIDGENAVLGAIFSGSGGSAYLFSKTPVGWVQQAQLTSSTSEVGDEFGKSVAMSGGLVAVGAHFDDTSAGNRAGSVTVFELPSSIEGFCFGDGGNQAGCTDCLCGNAAPTGSNGGCLNSLLASATLVWGGIPSISNDTLRFSVTGASVSTFGVLASGDNRLPANASNPCPSGSGIQSVVLDGLRCVGGRVLRHGVRMTDSNGNIGLTNAGWGPPDSPLGGIAATSGFSAGQTRHFQVFYRESPLAVCQTGQNTTQGLSATYRP